MLTNSGPFSLSFTLVAVSTMLVISLVLCIWRLAKGPSLADRVVAADMVGTIAMCLITIFVLLQNQPIFLDVVGALALIGFIGTISFAHHLFKEAQRDGA